MAMSSRPRLLTMSQLAVQTLTSGTCAEPPRPISPTPIATFHLQLCVICKRSRHNRKLFGNPLRILKEKQILKDSEGMKLGSGVKSVCEPCSIKLKKIFIYQNKIKTLEQKIAAVVEELMEKANTGDDVTIVQDDSDGAEEVEVISQSDVQQLQNVDPFQDNTEIIVTDKEPLPPLSPDENDAQGQSNQADVVDVVIKCEFEPEDVEVMPLPNQNYVESPSPQFPSSNSVLTTLQRQVDSSVENSKSSASAPIYGRYGHLTKLFVSQPAAPKVNQNDKSRVICPQCNIFFDGEASLSRHFKYSPKHASQEDIVTCGPCALTFPSLSKRIDHDRATHPEMFARSTFVKQISEIPTIKCVACGAEFYTEAGYDKHLLRETDWRSVGCEGGVACDRCSEVFRTLEERREHECDGDAHAHEWGNGGAESDAQQCNDHEISVVDVDHDVDLFEVKRTGPRLKRAKLIGYKLEKGKRINAGFGYIHNK